MIDSVGYTEDGQVWMRILMEVDGQKSAGVLTLEPTFAKNISDNLKEASEKAAAILEVKNERDSEHVDKGSPALN